MKFITPVTIDLENGPALDYPEFDTLSPIDGDDRAYLSRIVDEDLEWKKDIPEWGILFKQLAEQLQSEGFDTSELYLSNACGMPLVQIGDTSGYFTFYKKDNRPNPDPDDIFGLYDFDFNIEVVNGNWVATIDIPRECRPLDYN